MAIAARAVQNPAYRLGDMNGWREGDPFAPASSFCVSAATPCGIFCCWAISDALARVMFSSSRRTPAFLIHGFHRLALKLRSLDWVLITKYSVVAAL
jgi:hypothetical protein